MKKIKSLLFLATAILAVGSFVFVANNSSAAGCDLSLLDKNGNNTTQVTAGDRVSWRFNASSIGLKVYWFGSKNGKNDIWDVNNGFYSNSTYSGVIYKTGEEGNYIRYVAFKNDLGNTICVSPKVSFSVISAGSANVTTTPTPVSDSNSGISKTNDLLKGIISQSTSVPTLTTGSSVQAGNSINVSWSNIADPTANNWVGLYSSSSSPDVSGLIDWSYLRPTAGTCLKSTTGASTIGTCSFIVPATTSAGSGYEFRLFSSNAIKLTTSNSFTVVVGTSPTPTPTVHSFFIYNLTDSSRNPTFLSGDGIRFSASGPANQSLKSCWIFNGNSGCDTGTYAFNSNGTWSLDSQVLGISVGTWSRWIEVGGAKSNVVNFTVIGSSPLNITTSSPLLNGQLGTAYSTPISGSGGTGSYSWRVESGILTSCAIGASYCGGLPPGLSLTQMYPPCLFNATVCPVQTIISGTPTTAGTYTFTLRLVDESGSKGVTKQFVLTVNSATTNRNPTIAPSRQTVASAQIASLNFTYPSNTVRATLYLYCPTGVNTGPNNLCNTYIPVTFNSNWSSAFWNTTGSPQNVVPNYYIYTSDNPNYAVGVSSEITVNPVGIPTPVITVTNPIPNSSWLRGQNQTVSWQYLGPSQYAKIRLSAYSGRIYDVNPGLLSAGTASFYIPADFPLGNAKLYVMALDESVFGMVQGYINIIDSNSLTITTNSPLPNATVGTNYLSTIEIIIGSDTSGVNWNITSGSLPPGITYVDPPVGATCANLCYRIGGTPTRSGTYTFTFTVTSNPPTGSDASSYTASKQFTLTVDPVATNPAITVNSPNGGEIYRQPAPGQPISQMMINWIRNWMPTSANGKVSVYYNQGGLNQLIGENVSDPGMVWSIPNSLSGSNFKIVVTSNGSGGSLMAPLSDESDGSFSILASTPTPTTTSTPVPQPTVLPNKIYTSSEIYDGDIIRGQGDIAVWIIKTVGEKRFKRWLFGPQLFKIYGHLGFGKVKNVTKITLTQFDSVNLIRKYGDEKVYELTDYIPGVQAIKRWVPSLDIFLQRGFDTDSIYTVNDGEFNLYKEGIPSGQ